MGEINTELIATMMMMTSAYWTTKGKNGLDSKNELVCVYGSSLKRLSLSLCKEQFIWIFNEFFEQCETNQAKVVPNES